MIIINKSYWLETSSKKQYPTLEEDITGDILIIGGGISGISLAYELSKLNKKIILVDQNELYHGTTGYTTGKVTYQHGYIYHNLIVEKGIDSAREYYNLQYKAFERIKHIIHKHNIDCDYNYCDAVLFDDSKDSSLLDLEEKAYQRLSISYEKINFNGHKALKISNQAYFNIVKYLDGILRVLNENDNVQIYENTKIMDSDIEKKIAYTYDNKITFQTMISASFYPVYKKVNLFFSKLKPVMSYVAVATAPESFIPAMAINISKPTLSIRPLCKNKIVLAGLSNDVANIGNYNEIETLKNLGEATYDINEYEQQWYNQDYQTSDRLPFIGEIAKDIYMVCGYNKWGITTACMSSLLIKDSIETGKTKYDYLFGPKRSAKVFKQIMFMGKSVKALLVSKLKYPKYNNKKLKLICPHMLSTLRYNSIDGTYDCPCHGSRFDANGKVINGPSRRNLEFK